MNLKEIAKNLIHFRKNFESVSEFLANAINNLIFEFRKQTIRILIKSRLVAIFLATACKSNEKSDK